MTNGFDKSKVLDALNSRLAWKLPLGGTLANNEDLDTTLTESASGRYYDDFHPLVNLNNLYDIQPFSDLTVTNFNTYVSELNDSSILNVMNSIFDETNLLENGLTAEYDEEVTPLFLGGDKFVGYKLEVAENSACTINQLVLMFNGAATFNVYLYHSRKKQPIKTKSVTTVADEQVIVDLTDWNINPYDYKGGYFYIGYYQSDLGSVKAYDNDDEIEDFNYIEIEAVEIEVQNSLPNYALTSETSYSYGLILDISVYRDFTKKIVSMPHIFDAAIGLFMAVHVIEMFIYTLRSNSTERIASNDDLNRLYVALNTSEDQTTVPYIAGLKQQLQKALKDIKKSFNNKSKVIVVTPC